MVYSPYIVSTRLHRQPYTTLFSRVREYGKVILLVRFYSTWRSIPPMETGERCRDSIAIHAFVDNGNYMINIVFAPFVYRVATDGL
jgi:hypothetical protein